MDASIDSPHTNMIPDTPIEEKEAFYEQLDELEASIAEDDEISDPARQQSRAFFHRAKPGNRRRPQRVAASTSSSSSSAAPASKTPNSPSVPQETSSITESAPAITVQGHRTARQRMPTSTVFCRDNPEVLPPPATARLRRTQTTPNGLTSGSFAPSTKQQPSFAMAGNSSQRVHVKGKAKGTEGIPGKEQKLRGLRLFYIPGERIKLRKQRMERAEGHGAVVTKELSEATHVVVDENLTYDDIKIHVSAVLDNEKPIIVTDQWPLECIERKFVFPPSRRFRPKGMPIDGLLTVPLQGIGSAISEAQDQSLELKTPGSKRNRWDYVSPETTQSGASSIRPVEHPRAPSDLDRLDPQQAVVTGTASSPSSAQNDADEAHCEPQQPSPIRRSSSEFADELAQIVHQVREDFKDVPRIGEDDANDHGEGDNEQADDSGTDEGREKKRRKKGTSKRIGKQRRGAEKFRCHTGGTKDNATGRENPNALVISVLKKMSEYYTQTNDRWRPIAYRRAITELEGITDRKISTAEEAMELPCFGPRLADKLEEIVNTHSLARLDYALNDPMSKISALFLGIYGVGKSTADKWIAQGFRTLDDLLQNAKLTDNQRMGIDHYQDLNTRIPREEVTKLGDYVKAEAAKIDSTVYLLIGGSYRRGAETSGDIDFIITKTGTTSSKDLVPFMGQLVGNLWRLGFLTAEVASHSSRKDSDGSKWHGCCVLPRISGFNDDESYRPIWRRIDLLLVPENEYGAALIYFTGNDIFNRSLRLLASKKGMKLNQRGLYKDVMRGAAREKLTEGELVEGKDERRIFEILKVKWREPMERWC